MNRARKKVVAVVVCRNCMYVMDWEGWMGAFIRILLLSNKSVAAEILP